MAQSSGTIQIAGLPATSTAGVSLTPKLLSEMEEEIPLIRETLDTTPKNHPDRPILLRELTGRLAWKFAREPVMSVLFEAIDVGREAINSLPPNHPDRALWSKHFENVLGDRFSAAIGTINSEEPIDKASYLRDCGPGELVSDLPPTRRPLGSGPQNLPYDDDGNLSIFDIFSGVFDASGRWSYLPIQRGIFKGGHRRIVAGSYEYNPGDFLYEEDGISYLIGSEEFDQHQRFLGIDKWTHLPDLLPACFGKLKGMADVVPHIPTKSRLCVQCSNIDLESTLSSLDITSNDCELCKILSHCPREQQPELKLVDARAYLRICSVPGLQPTIGPVELSLEESQPGPLSDEKAKEQKVHSGLPMFLSSGSQEHFLMINEWLRLCDEGKCGHPSGCAPGPIRGSDVQPARVVRVLSKDATEDIVHLVATESLGELRHYVALSHCWGSQSNGPPPWCTTRANQENRMAQGMPIENLPANFQDAIQVTRKLGKEYLWIDSLCILQGDKEDWSREGKKMAHVFKNAYCTIAASSAENSHQGFLNRRAQGKSSQYVLVPNSSHGPVYISNVIDDFAGDVEQAVLSSRAWVLQERVLARRTIHFTKRQTYWECGGGVRCETLTYMRNEGKSSLISDPDFPSSLTDRSSVAKFGFFSGFFERYSQLGITQPTDRPIAIDALARELAIALNTNVNYGIFQGVLHRSLLWRRSDRLLDRISFEADQRVPSWSWMGYSGPIKYADIKQQFEWDSNVVLKAPQSLKARLIKLEFRGCRLRVNDSVHEIESDEQENLIGQLWYDNTASEISLLTQSAAIIGRQVQPEGVELKDQRKYFVLLIEELGRGIYKRIGIGLVDRKLIQFDGQDISIDVQ